MSIEESEKIVVFCDDRPKAFWLHDDKTRRGFDDSDWPGWKIVRIANPDEDKGEDWTEVFDWEIAERFSQSGILGEFFIVTDAHFGADALGGSKLLEALKDKLIRGVLFSAAPSLCAEGERLQREGRICVIPDDRAMDHRSCALAAKIREFLKDGVLPPPGPEAQMQLLSRAIHQLENLALPLRLDVETLESRGTEPDVVGDIWNDYFGSPANGGGFLLPGRTFSDGTSGIENEISRILESVRSVPQVTERERWKALDAEQGFIPETLANELGIEEARNNGDSFKVKSDDLKQTLTKVRDKIIELSTELRELRNQLDAHEEGGQP